MRITVVPKQQNVYTLHTNGGTHNAKKLHENRWSSRAFLFAYYFIFLKNVALVTFQQL